MKPGEIYTLSTTHSDYKNLKYIKFEDVRKRDDVFEFFIKGIDKTGDIIEGKIFGSELFDFISSSTVYKTSDSEKAKLLLSYKGF
jgi:hypothetical protein